MALNVNTGLLRMTFSIFILEERVNGDDEEQLEETGIIDHSIVFYSPLSILSG